MLPMQSPSQTSSLHLPRSVLWRPTAALASVNASITLSWIIYRVHLATLLTQAGFPAALAPLLLLLESVLAIGIEPWAGSVSDRTPLRFGGRFYIMLIGVGLTALMFVLLPGVQLLQPNAAVNWWLPGLLIVWSIAISLFRSPALALLGTYATPKQLPLAASLITLAGALAGSATPLASSWLLNLGTTITFVAAAILLLVTMGWLKTAQSEQTGIVNADLEFPSITPLRLSTLLRIFGLGLTVSLAFKLAVELFPKILKAAGIQPPLFMGVVFISLAIGALFAGWLATRWTNPRVMTIGLGLTVACLILMTLTHHVVAALLTAIALGLSFSLIINGTLPFALNFIPLQHAGLSIGLFFSGTATANSLYGGILQSRLSSPLTAIGLGVAALLVAGFCILGQTTLPAQPEPENE